jgi:hypothetical protein
MEHPRSSKVGKSEASLSDSYSIATCQSPGPPIQPHGTEMPRKQKEIMCQSWAWHWLSQIVPKNHPTDVYTSIYIYIHMCVCVCMCYMYIHMCVYMYIYIYNCIDIYTAYIYIYIFLSLSLDCLNMFWKSRPVFNQHSGVVPGGLRILRVEALPFVHLSRPFHLVPTNELRVAGMLPLPDSPLV